MVHHQLEEFLNYTTSCARNKTMQSLKLYDKRHNNDDVKKLLIKPVMLKGGYHLSFVFRHETKDITKNYTVDEGLSYIAHALEDDFSQAEIAATAGDWHVIIQSAKKVKLKKRQPASAAKPGLTHDKIKERMIAAKGNRYLHALGVTTQEGLVKKDMQDKYRQINKYIEIIDGILKDVSFEKKEIKVADMGAGKGYLTFALYDYLSRVQDACPQVVGVELRPELVDDGNALARRTGFDGLSFVAAKIEDVPLSDLDMLIALHACDTATDDALFRGIQAGAKVLVAAPCCHKQIRAQVNPDNALCEITQHGIMKERQAEMLTDTMRAILLTACGYKTRVFEFIATEHTPKNVLIVGIKKAVKNKDGMDKETMQQFDALKKMFGIKEHYLETLLLKEKQ